jgi:hypothetical protein
MFLTHKLSFEGQKLPKVLAGTWQTFGMDYGKKRRPNYYG